MSQDYSLLHILKTLVKWRKHIIIATGLTALVSIVCSLLMPNYYQSSALLYAASPTIANPDPVGGSEKQYFIYGTGEDLDRIFSIANSSSVKSHIIDKYNLHQVYDIDTTTSKGRAKLAKKFDKVYETTKTKFDALRLSIEDTDPVLARDMTRSAREFIQDKAQNMVKQSQGLLLNSLKEGIINQEKTLARLSDSLTNLKKKYAIYDSYSQAESYAKLTVSTDARLADKEALLTEMKKYPGIPQDSINKVKAVIAGVRSKQKTLASKVDNFNQGVLGVRQLEEEQKSIVEELALEKERYKKLNNSYTQSFTALHIVEKESIADEKSRPKRSIIVLGFTFLGFVLSSLFVLLSESFKEFKSKF